MSHFGTQLPKMVTRPPGPITSDWIDRLAEVECPAITARRARRAERHGGRDPIVWEEALGSNVRDVDGNVYVDLSSGFAVAGVGHRHPKVVEAAHQQLDRLIHGMGDLFPSREKIELAERIAQWTPGVLTESILATSGADAVEIAIKTAMIATGRRRVLGFHGGYHGLGLGALGVTAYRDSFREPFGGFAGATELRLPFPSCHDCPMGQRWPTCGMVCSDYVERVVGSEIHGSEDIAAVIVEPIQGRGGDIVPPEGWLRRLREWTQANGILLILDEIYTGFGRTGRWFACEHEGVVPDIMAIGKGMGGGFPISATVARPEVMAAWGDSKGEAIHTSTFLGNPLGSAMAVATIDVIDEEGLVDRAATMGRYIKRRLERELGTHPRVGRISGRGMMIGLGLLDREGEPWVGGAVVAMQALLERGLISAPSGHLGDIISLSPPFVITQRQIDYGIDMIVDWVHAL